MKAGKATRAGSLIPGVLTALLFSFNAAAQFGGGPPLPETVAPPQGFATSTEHYEFRNQIPLRCKYLSVPENVLK